MTASRTPWACALPLAALISCGQSSGPIAPDASAPDAGPRVLSTAEVLGPEVATLGDDTCFTAQHDGPPQTRVAWLAEPESTRSDGTIRHCFRWSRTGSFRIAVFLEDGARRAEASRVIFVVRRPSVERPSASSTIAYAAARGELWVVDPDNDAVVVIDAATAQRRAIMATCDHPRTVAVSGNVVAVACQDDGRVALYDAATRAPRGEGRFGRGDRPFGVAADPRGARFLVTLQEAGRLAVIDLEGRVLGGVDVGFDARGVAVNDRGEALVARWRGRGDGARVVRVDARSPEGPTRAGDIVLGRQENLDSDTDHNGVPSFLGALQFAPDGRFALVPALKANIVSGTFRSRDPLRADTTGRAILSELWLDGARGPEESFRHAFDDLDMASAVTFSPLGERIYTAIQGAEVVIVQDAATYDVVGSVRDVGGAPQGLWVSPDGARLFVHGYTSRTVRVFDVRRLSSPPLMTAEVSLVGRESLSPEVLRGERVFYASRDPRMSLTSYVSCASCHLDGEGDNLVWDFTQRGEGLRNTIPLAGRGGAAHGPIHWSANFDEVQDFEHDIRGGQGGAGFLSDAVFHTGTRDTPLGDSKAGLDPDLDALAAYVRSLSRFGVSPARRAEPVWTQSFGRGAEVFQSAGCAVCHSGSRFTDSAFQSPGVPVLHDVGTLSRGSGARLGAALTGIDTPTLRGLWRSAPYLHDGSAATLRDVLRARNLDERHGRTRALNEAQLTDLETFLNALDDEVP